MSFLSRLFGSGDPLDAIRISYQQSRWSDVLTRASSIDEKTLSSEAQAEFQLWLCESSDQLARLNLAEGMASLRSDDLRRGIEHLELAKQLARSESLLDEINLELSKVGGTVATAVMSSAPPQTINAKSCASSCCEQPKAAKEVLDPHGFDEATRFELVLTAYSPEERTRYLSLCDSMRQAILLAHEEEDEAARTLFSKISEAERNDIYFYEFGALLARGGHYREAVSRLETALAINPGQVLAMVTLVDLHLGHREFTLAEKLAESMLSAEYMPDFAQARLSFIWQARGNEEKAYEHAAEALRLGHRDPQLMVFVARMLEQQGRLDAAENLLKSIPTGGGCSGGVNIDLAEFWLRHNKNLQQSLEMFKNAAKGDPSNPIWGFHIARVYLALGWRKDAVAILEMLASSEVVDDNVRKNASQLLLTAV